MNETPSTEKLIVSAIQKSFVDHVERVLNQKLRWAVQFEDMLTIIISFAYEHNTPFLLEQKGVWQMRNKHGLDVRFDTFGEAFRAYLSKLLEAKKD